MPPSGTGSLLGACPASSPSHRKASSREWSPIISCRVPKSTSLRLLGGSICTRAVAGQEGRFSGLLRAGPAGVCCSQVQSAHASWLEAAACATAQRSRAACGGPHAHTLAVPRRCTACPPTLYCPAGRRPGGASTDALHLQHALRVPRHQGAVGRRQPHRHNHNVAALQQQGGGRPARSFASTARAGHRKLQRPLPAHLTAQVKLRRASMQHGLVTGLRAWGTAQCPAKHTAAVHALHAALACR